MTTAKILVNIFDQFGSRLAGFFLISPAFANLFGL
jgi:hypothetical protein